MSSLVFKNKKKNMSWLYFLKLFLNLIKYKLYIYDIIDLTTIQLSIWWWTDNFFLFIKDSYEI